MSVVSDPIANASDGTLPTGSFDVTIIETATSYVADNFSWDENSKKISSMSARGRNNRNKVIVTDITGSADFQLADVTTTAPRPRASFAIDADGDGNTEPYMVEKSGKAFTQDGETKCKTSLFACANPLIYRTGQAGTTGALSSTVTGNLTISAIAVTGADVGDLFTATAHGLLTGDRVTLTVSTGLTGLTTATDYYVILISANTFKLATSYANALAATVATFSADGTGFVTLGIDFSAYTPRDLTATAGSWLGTGLPTGITIDATTGKTSGKPTAGTYSSCKITTAGTITVDGVSETRTGVRKFTWVAS